MKKEQSKTLEARLGFDDPDLKTSKHDEIMLWLDKNIRTFPYEILNISKKWEDTDFSSDTNKRLEDVYFRPEKPSIDISDLIWELPVTKKNNGSDYIVGFIDLAVFVKEPRLFLGKELDLYYRTSITISK